MWDSWKIALGLIGLTSAAFGALTTLFGLWKFYGQRIKEKDEEIKILQQKLDPKIAIDRDRYLEQVNHLKNKVEEIKEDLHNERLVTTELRGKTVALQHRLKSIAEKANEFARIANNNAAAYRRLKTRTEQLQSDLGDLKDKAEHERMESEARLIEAIQEKEICFNEELEKKKNQLSHQIETLRKENDQLQKSLGERNEEIENQGFKIKELDAARLSWQERDEQMLNPQARIWEREIPAKVPAFVPLAKRRAPIISVLNLKGGVGKTTITANLAATLEYSQQKSTLVIDLDYQRSLTRLCCAPDRLKELHDDDRCIQHFFLDSNSNSGLVRIATLEENNGSEFESRLSRRLRSCTERVRRNGQELFRLVACSEVFNEPTVSGTLDDTEMHLFAQWLLHQSDSDSRFFLREALHSMPIQRDFDYILLDCPPRLSLACINALAASDFVLIPVLLDETSIVSVPLLLTKLNRLRQVAGLMPNLKILGIVANKVESTLLPFQRQAENDLSEYIAETWNNPVGLLDTKIPFSREFGNAAGQNQPDFAVLRSTRIRDFFTSLIDDMKARIQNESESLAVVPQ